MAVKCRKGRVHDFRILKEDRPAIHPEIKKLMDSGYQGVGEIYSNTEIPKKKTKNNPLTKEDKAHNHQLAKKRIGVEHVNRRCKIFRIVKETYRGKHKNYSKTWNIIAALVNIRFAE